MKQLRLMITALMALTLAACFQTELGGSVAGADVTITELRTGAVVQEGLQSRSLAQYLAERSRARWDNLNSLGKMINLGNFNVDDSLYAADRWYLITATGGGDMDPDMDGEVVSDDFKPVAGTWRAIIRGDRLRDGGFMVSALTEALYRAAIDDVPQLDDAQLSQRLNRLAATVVNDVDENGGVNYTDVLSWTVLVHQDNYLLEQANLQALVDGIADGADETELAGLARQVMGENAVDPLQFYAENVSAQVVQRRCVNCHTSGGVAPSRGARLVVVTDNTNDFVATNHQAFIRFGNLLGDTDLSDYVVGKATGRISHGGGVQISPGSADADNLETYLNLLE